MFSMWACGWCAGMAFTGFMNGNYFGGAICVGLALFNGLLAYASWRDKH